MRNKFFIVVAGLLLVSTVLACNMLRGAGQDVENTGENIKDTVDKND